MDVNISADGNLTRFPNPTESTILFVFLVLICTVSIAANFVVILTTLRTKRMRTAGSVFLLNLAFSDFLVGSLVVPVMLEGVLRLRWAHGKVGISFFLYVTVLYWTYKSAFTANKNCISNWKPFSPTMNAWNTSSCLLVDFLANDNSLLLKIWWILSYGPGFVLQVIYFGFLS